jgi:hypothetical protein
VTTRSRFLLVGLLATLAGVGLGVGWWLFYRPQISVTVPAAPPPPAPPPVKGPDPAVLAGLDAATAQARRANEEAARKIAQLEERMRGDLCPKPPPPPPPPPPPRPPESRMQMPEKPGDLASLKGCWRTDSFRHEPSRAAGIARYCFDANGRGTLVFQRPGEGACRAPARIRFDGTSRLTIDDSGGRCDGGGTWYPDVLQCQGDAQRVVRCSGSSDMPGGRHTWTVNLHRD